MSSFYHYSYARRGTTCNSITPALTSNRKFLQPNSQVYSQVLTQTLRYPGCASPQPQSHDQNQELHLQPPKEPRKCNC